MALKYKNGYNDKVTSEEIAKLYLNGMTAYAIAKRFNVSVTMINYRLKKLNILKPKVNVVTSINTDKIATGICNILVYGEFLKDTSNVDVLKQLIIDEIDAGATCSNVSAFVADGDDTGGELNEHGNDANVTDSNSEGNIQKSMGACEQS